MPEDTISVNEELANPQNEQVESLPPDGAETPTTKLDGDMDTEGLDQRIPKTRFDEVNNKLKEANPLIERYELAKRTSPDVAKNFPTLDSFYEYALRRAIMAEMQEQEHVTKKESAVKVEEKGEEEADEEDEISKLKKEYESIRVEQQAEKEQKIVSAGVSAFQEVCKEKGLPEDTTKALFPIVYESFVNAFYRNNPDIAKPTYYPSPNEVVEFTKNLIDHLSKLSFASAPKPVVTKPVVPPIPQTSNRIPTPKKPVTKEEKREILVKSLKNMLV